MNEKASRLTIRVAWWMQIVLAAVTVSLAVGAVYALISVFEGSIGNLFLLMVLVALAYIFGANALSTIQITDESVTVNVFYGRFRIYWAEIIKIMVNSPLMALIGNDKRVVLSLDFAGRNAGRMLEIFDQQIKTRGILLEQGTFPITHQNARV